MTARQIEDGVEGRAASQLHRRQDILERGTAYAKVVVKIF